ncbi:peptidase S10 [Burkholderia lata]|nr:peptidase S10 [Burkholderia lata]
MKAGLKFAVVSLSAAAILSACGGDDDSAAGPQAAETRAAALRQADRPFVDPNTYSPDPDASLPANASFDQAAVTHHTMQLNGKTVHYTATAGHLTAIAPRTGPTQPADKEVSFFYVAYTLDGAPTRKRPVTFFWNGGPGSSTIWLHLGSWGPKTLDIDEASLTPDKLQTQPARFPLVDNDVTMLNDSDIVFVDAPGTGYSEAVAPHRNQDFWGIDKDAETFRDFITRYIKVNAREASPKYLYGESYGGIRTPIVASLLEQQGSLGKDAPVLNGVMLNSPILSYKTNCYMKWNFSGADYDYEKSNGNITKTTPEVSCGGFIPSYAAVSYSLKNPGATQQTVADLVAQAEVTTSQQWSPDLQRYFMQTANIYPDPTYDASLFTQSDQALFSTMATLTAQAPIQWETAFNMNVPDYSSAALSLPDNQWDKWGYWSRMDRYNGLVTIPAGTNYVGADGAPLGPDNQDAEDYNDPAFANEIKTYLPDFLKYSSQSTYAIDPPAIIDAWKWQHGSDASTHPTSLPDLSEAMSLDPKLKVVVFHGYHDLACPYYQGVLDLAGAGLASSVPIKAFSGGHMIYLTKSSRAPMKQTIDDFFHQS